MQVYDLEKNCGTSRNLSFSNRAQSVNRRLLAPSCRSLKILNLRRSIFSAVFRKKCIKIHRNSEIDFQNFELGLFRVF